jgi:hypothetical protein
MTTLKNFSNSPLDLDLPEPRNDKYELPKLLTFTAPKIRSKLVQISNKASKSRLSKLPNAVQAIRDAVAALSITQAAEGFYDGHDVINWLNDHRNNELNDIIDRFGNNHDRVHYATIQIGNFLKNELGQEKVGERVSDRRIRLRDGLRHDGKCKVSVWRISTRE